MKIINKTLSGKVSFRGLGFVSVDGLFTAICGSRLVECGNGAQVRWMDEQLQQVPAEPEIKATFKGTFDDAAIAGDKFFTSHDGKNCLWVGELEGHILGADVGVNAFIIVPPLRVTFLPRNPRVNFGLDGLYNVMDPVATGDDGFTQGVFINLAE